MSAVVIVDDELREKVAQTIADLATNRKSVAARIKSEFRDEITDAVAEDVETTGDLEVSVILSLSRVLKSHPYGFVPKPKNPNSMTIFARKTK